MSKPPKHEIFVLKPVKIKNWSNKAFKAFKSFWLQVLVQNNRTNV